MPFELIYSNSHILAEYIYFIEGNLKIDKLTEFLNNERDYCILLLGKEKYNKLDDAYLRFIDKIQNKDTRYLKFIDTINNNPKISNNIVVYNQVNARYYGKQKSQ